jgi:hypothetical protein
MGGRVSIPLDLLDEIGPKDGFDIDKGLSDPNIATLTISYDWSKNKDCGANIHENVSFSLKSTPLSPLSLVKNGDTNG